MSRAPRASIYLLRSGLLAAWAVGAVCWTAPAAAQTNLIGYWNPLFHEDVDERIPGPSIGDYLGLADQREPRACAPRAGTRRCCRCPSTNASRIRRLTAFAASACCASGRIATRTRSSSSRFTRTSRGKSSIARSGWTAARIRPSTPRIPGRDSRRASWEGDVLVVKTTHLKAGWIRRNGLPLSDRATMTDRFHRYGDVHDARVDRLRSRLSHRAAREDQRLPAVSRTAR